MKLPSAVGPAVSASSLADSCVSDGAGSSSSKAYRKATADQVAEDGARGVYRPRLTSLTKETTNTISSSSIVVVSGNRSEDGIVEAGKASLPATAAAASIRVRLNQSSTHPHPPPPHSSSSSRINKSADCLLRTAAAAGAGAGDNDHDAKRERNSDDADYGCGRKMEEMKQKSKQEDMQLNNENWQSSRRLETKTSHSVHNLDDDGDGDQYQHQQQTTTFRQTVMTRTTRTTKHIVMQVCLLIQRNYLLLSLINSSLNSCHKKKSSTF